MISSNELRNSIIAHLMLASSASSVRAYQEGVPIADVVAEVFCGWKDVYHPAVPPFGAAFAVYERVALAHFDRVVDQVAEDTPEWIDLED